VLRLAPREGKSAGGVSPVSAFPETKPLGFLTAEDAKAAEQAKAWFEDKIGSALFAFSAVRRIGGSA